MGNASHAHIKRHKLLIKPFANTPYKILNLGNKSKEFIKFAKKMNVNIEWGGWDLRKNLPQKISQCKIGICCSTNYDSCPRVIPEYFACGLPVIATENINFWHEKYINEQTGLLVEEKQILESAKKLINMHKNPINYYENKLSMSCAANYLHSLIEDIL